MSVGAPSPSPSATASTAATSPSPTDDTTDVLSIPELAPLEPGPYRIDVSYDDEPIIRVRYTLSADGWRQWIGGFKEDGDGRWVGVSIANVTNLVTDGCHNHVPADPPVGGTVDDLATALATLAPFEVLEQPRDVTAYGYSGRYLRLIVPSDIPFETVEGTRFTQCFQGLLQSWIEPLSDAFYGYAAPGHVEEFWILDVDGRRLMIEANWFEDSPPEHLAEMRSVLDSIEIQP